MKPTAPVVKPVTFLGNSLEALQAFPRDARQNAGYQIYVARRPDAVYVLHAFQKKTRKTSAKDIDIAAQRLRGLLKG